MCKKNFKLTKSLKPFFVCMFVLGKDTQHGAVTNAHFDQAQCKTMTTPNTGRNVKLSFHSPLLHVWCPHQTYPYPKA